MISYLSLKRKKPVRQREMLKIEIIPNQFVLYNINTLPFFLPYAYTEKGSDIDHSRSVVLTMKRTIEPKPTIINIFWRLLILYFYLKREYVVYNPIFNIIQRTKKTGSILLLNVSEVKKINDMNIKTVNARLILKKINAIFPTTDIFFLIFNLLSWFSFVFLYDDIFKYNTIIPIIVVTQVL
tara:strand:- start:23 stop:568 length:546 start_codon:yes stop_codon:yes gene_type:complete